MLTLIVVISLNPCFSGICSQRTGDVIPVSNLENGLNPCFSGICSQRLLMRSLLTT